MLNIPYCPFFDSLMTENYCDDISFLGDDSEMNAEWQWDDSDMTVKWLTDYYEMTG